MDLFIRYHSQTVDEELDSDILDIFGALGFEITYVAHDEGNRDIFFERYDPFDDMDSTSIH